MATIRKLDGAPPPPAGPAPQRRALPAPAAAGERDGVIVVQGLEKTYRDGTRAVRGVGFAVRRGETFGLLGPNGAGKTTLMRILGTLHPASAGTARILGLDVARQSAEVRARIGFAMQEVGIDDLATAREMLVLHARLHGIARAEAEARAKALLGEFDLAAHADRRVTRFSGGMKRRLDVAVSLIHDPEVLILDEPSTGLDPRSRGDLWATLRRLKRERRLTVLMSTHYMDEADALCDRVAFMNLGRIAAVDAPAALKRSLGGDVVQVQLGAEPTAEQRAALEKAFGAGRVRVAGATVGVQVEDGARALAPTLRVLGDLGLAAAQARAVSPSLDDVFLRYTGHTLEESQAAPKPAPGAQGARR